MDLINGVSKLLSKIFGRYGADARVEKVIGMDNGIEITINVNHRLLDFNVSSYSEEYYQFINNINNNEFDFNKEILKFFGFTNSKLFIFYNHMNKKPYEDNGVILKKVKKYILQSIDVYNEDIDNIKIKLESVIFDFNHHNPFPILTIKTNWDDGGLFNEWLKHWLYITYNNFDFDSYIIRVNPY